MKICEEPRLAEIFKMIRGFFKSGLEDVEIEAR